MILDLLAKIKEKLDAAKVSGGLLEDVQFIDYGAALPILRSDQYPAVFLTVVGSRHPEVRAAGGATSGYDHIYDIHIVIASYILKTTSNEGYEAAFKEAADVLPNVISICRDNKTWDSLCYSSEVAEESAVTWGILPWSSWDDIVYGIVIPLTCRAKAA